MAFFNTKQVKEIQPPIPPTPPYNPPTPPTPPTPSEGSSVYIPRPPLTTQYSIVLYNTTDEIEKLNKSLTQLASFNITLKEDEDILNPVIIISSSANLLDCNYAYIEQFKRYYFVNIKLLTGNTYQLVLNVDPLMSHRSQLMNVNCIVDKVTSNSIYSNMDYDDGSFATQKGVLNQVIVFNTGFNPSPQAILMCVGKDKDTTS